MKIVILHTADALEPRDPLLDQLDDALRAASHETSFVALGTDVGEVVRSLQSAAPELVFNVAESFDGRSALESSVAGLLNLLKLRYTGSSPAGLLMAGDKSLTKKLLGFHGIQSPAFTTMWRGAVDWSGELQFPLIVKPPQEDASIGITSASVVHDLKELFGQMDALQTEFRSPVLVEQYVEGREFYVGVLGNVDAVALPIIELDFTGFPDDRPRIASWDAKWEEADAEYKGTRSVFAEGLDEALAARMQQVALDAFHALRLRDYARIDLRVTDAGEIYVIEVNPNCYLEREAEFCRAAAKVGTEYPALVARIVELASARYAR